MKLSKRGEYGMRTLINLGIAREVGREVVAASDLAQVDHLPLKFVEQILADFRHAGIVGTKRGKFGGYFLDKPAQEIKMGDMVRLLDGMLAPISCASESFYQKCTCADEDHCGLRMLMIDVRNAVSNILDRYTLGDVVEVTLRKLRRDKLPIPFSLDGGKDAATLGEAKRYADPTGGFLAILKEIPEKETISPELSTRKAVTRKAVNRKAVTRKAATPKSATPKSATRKAVTRKAATPKSATPKSVSLKRKK